MGRKDHGAAAVKMHAYVAIHSCGGALAAQVHFGEPVGKPPKIRINGLSWPTKYFEDLLLIPDDQCKCESPRPAVSKRRKMKPSAR